MVEQERYKHLLAYLIQQTESSDIESTEEMIQTLIYELTGDYHLQ